MSSIILYIYIKTWWLVGRWVVGVGCVTDNKIKLIRRRRRKKKKRKKEEEEKEEKKKKKEEKKEEDNYFLLPGIKLYQIIIQIIYKNNTIP